jgi:hypothetical protein
MSQDKTFRDNNRRPLNLIRDEVRKALPEYFGGENPQFINLLEKYYQFMDSADNPSRIIQDLYLNRDLTQIEEGLLQFIEDELLLGQSYFEGFINKREAAKFSNTLYRSKGTLYSIQQFFRAFFGVDPDVVYTKENVFLVGPARNNAGEIIADASRIGSESERFLTNDELYQTLAILIRSPVAFNKWRDVYKLFVHPAGMYIGAELQVVSVAELDTEFLPAIVDEGIIIDRTFEEVASIFAVGFDDVTALVPNDAGTGFVRHDVRFRIQNYQDLSISYLASRYGSINELLSASSPNMDDDTDGSGAAIKFSDTRFESFDQHTYSGSI